MVLTSVPELVDAQRQVLLLNSVTVALLEHDKLSKRGETLRLPGLPFGEPGG